MKKDTQRTPSLNYHQPSPVRGQLEPYDPRTNKGWPGRFLQCTDTPNQLKVLLPPATAEFYDQLLKAEVAELARRPPIAWERILEIRHLKDRMIRKCQKLCKTARMRRLGHGESFAFQTFIAPPDFRLKEMEKWLKQYQFNLPSITSGSIRSQTALTARQQSSVCCSRCSRPDCSDPHKSISPTDSFPNSVSVPRLQLEDAPPAESAFQVVTAQNIITPGASFQSNPSVSQRTNASSPPSRNEVFSPPPLPHPFRPRSGVIKEEYTSISRSPEPEPSNQAQVPNGTQDTSVLPTIPEDTTVQTTAAPLRRRRSCIKRSGMGDTKTVSWADDRDWTNQMSKYTDAAHEAQVSGRKWEEIRAIYTEQLAGLESLHQHILEGLQRIRIETEHLQNIEHAITEQREKMQISYEELKMKQARFHAKVQAALEEADNMLVICGAKQDVGEQAS